MRHFSIFVEVDLQPAELDRELRKIDQEVFARLLVASHDTERPISAMVDGLPVDIIPSRILRMVLVTAQERDASLGVLNDEDVAKRLRFEETETEREVQ